MKKYSIFALILVLTLSVLTGCRGPMDEPTETQTTIPATMPTIAPDTTPAVPETTEAPRGTEGTIGSTEGSMGGTEESLQPSETGNSGDSTTDTNARSRRMG